MPKALRSSSLGLQAATETSAAFTNHRRPPRITRPHAGGHDALDRVMAEATTDAAGSASVSVILGVSPDNGVGIPTELQEFLVEQPG